MNTPVNDAAIEAHSADDQFAEAARPRIYSWVSHGGAVMEQVRVSVRGERIRALGHVIAAQTEDRPAFSLSYDVEAEKDGQVRRVGLQSVSLDADRSVNLRRDGEGEWLLEDAAGRNRVGEARVRDVHIVESMLFYSLAIKSHGFHRQQTEEELTALSIDPVSLEVHPLHVQVRSDEQMIHMINADEGQSATVDADGFIVSVPGSKVERR